jgi:KDO2-lipid IV(A) lauroyltransferase
VSSRALDRRTGGAWTVAQTAKNAFIYAGIHGTLGIVGLLPGSALRALGRGVGALAHAILPKARRTARANVARALPELDAAAQDAVVRASYRSLGEWLGETVAAFHGRGPPPLSMDETSRDVLAQAHAEGRGVVFASAHLGPWERVASSLVAAGFPLTTIARESYDPRLTRIYDRLRGRAGVRAIYRGAPGAAARIVRTLREGGVLGVPMDLRSRVPSIDVPFLGHDAPTPVGPARIALRTGAAVVVGTAAPVDDGGLGVRVVRIETRDLDEKTGERDLTARINAELSGRILAFPHGWVWMHPRWAD